MNADCIPKSYKNLRDWLRIQKDVTPEIATSLGMTPAEQAEYLAVVYTILPRANTVIHLMNDLEHHTEDLEKLLQSLLPVLRRIIQRVQAGSECTPELTQRLHWTGDPTESGADADWPLVAESDS